MYKKNTLVHILNSPFGKMTNSDINYIAVVAEKNKITASEAQSAIISNLTLNENWDFEKAENLVSLTKELCSEKKHSTFDRVLRFPSDESLRELKHYLSLACCTIKVCMYTFTSRILMNWLMDAKKRGVEIKLITDKESLSSLYIHEMAASGIKCTHHNLSSHAKMHHKFCIIDDYIFINGSLNWTAKGIKQNHENVMVTGSQVFISQFNAEFAELWK